MLNNRMQNRVPSDCLRIFQQYSFILLVMILAGCINKPQNTLEVQFRGCIIYIERAPRPFCATGVSATVPKKLYLSISGTPLAKFSIDVNQTPRFSGAIAETGKVTVILDAADTDGLLSINLDEPRQERVFSADISAKNPFVNALAVRDQIKKQPPSEWPRLVEQGLVHFDETARTFSPTEQAYLLGQFGSILELTARDIPDEKFPSALRELAIRVLHRAIDAAHAVGLLSVEAVSLRRLSTIYTKGVLPYGPYAEAAIRELTDPVHRKAFLNDPDAEVFVHYKISRIEEDFGKIGNSLTAIRQILPLLEFEGLKDTEKELYLTQYALISQYSNDTESALHGSKQAIQILTNSQAFKSCEFLQYYNIIGWVHILAQQAGYKDVTPIELLQKADSYRAKCTAEDPNIASYAGGLVLLNLARAYLLQAVQTNVDGAAREQAVTQVERLIQEARALQVSRSDYYLDVHDLTGQIALLRKDGTSAFAAFRRLRQLTSNSEMNPLYRWSALIGEADALVMLERKAEALAAYGEAAQLLLRLANGLPMLGRRQMFVSQFEEGISRHLALLAADSSTKGPLLAAMRRARMLALQVYMQPLQSGFGAMDGQPLLARYQELHAQRDSVSRELHDAPLAERAEISSRLRALDDALRQVIDQLYRGPAGAPPPESAAALRPPQEGELLLACYPSPNRARSAAWLCAAADTQDHYVVRSSGLTGAGAAELLKSLQTPLSRAKRLHVLAYGEMRDVIWEQVPFMGQSLGARIPVSYGLDLIAAAVPDAARRALLVLNPEQDLSGAHHAEKGLIARLTASGWKLELFRGAPRHGRHLFGFLHGSLFDSVRPALGPLVLERLPAANLFVYYGHAESSRQGGWDSHLRFADDGSITARDILALPTVPRRVLLLGCETAVSDRGAPADELGLAQAFLLRGSREVLATTRKVPDALAALLLTELLQRGALDVGAAPLAESLRAALMALRSRTPHGDWDAFRVYQP